jgi:hypothetical protein
VVGGAAGKDSRSRLDWEERGEVGERRGQGEGCASLRIDPLRVRRGDSYSPLGPI